MWLRDYLPKDLQNRARILIYGYPSTLRGSHSRSSLGDYSACFMQDLMGIRSQHGIQDRPIIFIGHSLGGLIVKKALTDLRADVLSRLPVRSILFFGTPHEGLNISALQTMVAGQPNENLVRDLGENSSALDNLSDGFERIANSIKIYSFVETHETPVFVEVDGVWQRGTKREMMVSKRSARLRYETETVRMVNADHLQMIKLRKGQGSDYPYIVSIIKEALQSAPEKWQHSQRGDQEPGPFLQSIEHGTDLVDPSEPAPVELQINADSELQRLSPFEAAESNRSVRASSSPAPRTRDASVEVAELGTIETTPSFLGPPPPEYTAEDQNHPYRPPSQPQVGQLESQLAEMNLGADGGNINDPGARNAMFERAKDLCIQGSPDGFVEAEEIFRRLLEYHERNSGPHDVSTLSVLTPLALTLEKQNKVHDADCFLSLAVRRGTEGYGATHEAVLKTVDLLINFKMRHDKHDEAETLCRGLLQCRLDSFGPSHRKTVDCDLLLSECLVEKQEWVEAKERLVSSVTWLTTMLQDDDEDLIKPVQLLARVCEGLQDYDGLEIHSRKVLSLMDRNYYSSKSPLPFLEAKNLLVKALEKQGKHYEAHSILKGMMSSAHGFDFGTLDSYGVSIPQLLCSTGKQLSHMRGSLEAAEGALLEANRLLDELTDEQMHGIGDQTFIVELSQYLGRVCRDMGRYADAVGWLTEALDDCTDDEQWMEGSVLADLALTRDMMGQLPSAVETYARAIEAFDTHDMEDESLDTTLDLAQVYMKMQNYPSAEATLRGLLCEQMSSLPRDDSQVLDACDLLADALDAMGNYTAANEIRVSGAEAILGPETGDSSGLPPEQLIVHQELALPTIKTWAQGFEDFRHVLHSLGITSTDSEDSPEFLRLDCLDQGHSFQLAATAGDGILEIQLEAGPNVSFSPQNVMSKIQRLLAPTLLGNRVRLFCHQLSNGLSAAEFVRVSEAILRNLDINVGPMEGLPTQSRHRCQVKKTRLFKSNKKVMFHMMHDILPVDREGLIEISFELVQGDKTVFREIMARISSQLETVEGSLSGDEDDYDE